MLESGIISRYVTYIGRVQSNLNTNLNTSLA